MDARQWLRNTTGLITCLPEDLRFRSKVLRDMIYRGTNLWGNKKVTARGVFLNIALLYDRTRNADQLVELFIELESAIADLSTNSLRPITRKLRLLHKKLDRLDNKHKAPVTIHSKSGGQKLGRGCKWWRGGV